MTEIELPEPHWAAGYRGAIPQGAYTAEQVRAAVLAERDRCARLCEWLPISTAPKDGTRVLLYRANWQEPNSVGWYSSNNEGWMIAGTGAPAWLGATHWMPLPPPPKGSQVEDNPG